MIRFYQWFSSKALWFTFQIQKKRFSVPSGLKSIRINFFLYSVFSIFFSFHFFSHRIHYLWMVLCRFECFISLIDFALCAFSFTLPKNFMIWIDVWQQIQSCICIRRWKPALVAIAVAIVPPIFECFHLSSTKIWMKLFCKCIIIMYLLSALIP